MDMKRFFLYAIVIAALALAGCGGNGGTAMVEPPPTCPSGQTGTPPNCVTPGPSVEDLFTTAQTARDNATGAVTAAENAVKAAMENSGKLGVLAVMGDSSMAKANAQAVLDAQTAANTAVTTAETQVTNLNTADTNADTYNNATLDKAIADALKVAQQAVKDAKAERDGDMLKGYVAMVTGTDKDDVKTPTDTQKTVAMQISGALAPKVGSVQEAARVMHYASAAADQAVVKMARDDEDLTVDLDDHQGMTWEQIVGSGVVDKRIASDGATKAVRAMSVSGMTVTSTAVVTVGDAVTDNGTQVVTDTASENAYKGIPGTYFCQGSDCAVKAVTGKAAMRELVGSWYFTPANPETWYLATDTTGTSYTPEMTFVRFGHWLSTNSENANNTDINTFAYTSARTGVSAYDLNTVNTATGAILTDTSATYAGKAAGMSHRQTFGTDGVVVAGSRQSGAFTADVSLTATFGPEADNAVTLGGTINNFMSDNADAVDSTWSVQLQSRGFQGGNFGDGAGRTVASGQDGTWSAQAYGSGTMTKVDGEGVPNTTTGIDTLSVRPTGIFGGFNANFSNGAAAGAYATRKQ